jgi:ThiF family
MTAWLERLSACVIGVSGTGSIVAEQLARLGFGEIILIDFDHIEPKNLNRILNSTLADAEAGMLKVEAIGATIRRYRNGCQIVEVPRSIATREAILAATDADFLFSCVDTGEGRHIADRIAAYFLMPLFDVGVSIPTCPSSGTGRRSIIEVCGRIDYVFPGSSNLQDRNVYTAALLEAEYLAQTAPETYQRKLNDGYLKGAGEQAPAVISLNMRAASACVMEFIARAFPFRHDSNAKFSRSIFTLCGGEEDFYSQQQFAARHTFALGAGAQEPLIGLPSFMGVPNA